MAQNKAVLAPSLLSADFSKLQSEVLEIEKAGAEWLHVDVMDGHFVPNLTVGPLVVEALKPHSKLFMDCHLMVAKPEQWIGPFAKAGARMITVHAEATTHLNRLLHSIKDQGVQAGVSINPATPLSLIEEVLGLVDLVLVMSVNPGFGGQKFISSATDKIKRLTELRGSQKFLIEVDGGITLQNVETVLTAGADVIVAGSAVFGQKNRAEAVQSFHDLFKKHGRKS